MNQLMNEIYNAIGVTSRLSMEYGDARETQVKLCTAELC